ncbi:MAG: hypothetical protein WCQ53_03610, partial [bacterium]
MKTKLTVLFILISTLLPGCLLRSTGGPAVDASSRINPAAKSITEFSIAGVDAMISGLNISLTVPFGTDITSITPTITHTGVSISPAVGPTDFTSPVHYTVTAYNGSTQTYTVTVSVATSAAKSIISFSILGNLGNFSGPNGTNILVTVPFATDVTSLTPAITITGTSVTPASGVVQDFSFPINYTVTAANGTTQTYVVTVVNAPSSGKAITEFSLAGSAGTISSTNIAVTVPHGTNLSSIAPTSITHNGASIAPAVGAVLDFTMPVAYTVTAADGSTQTYMVTATEAPASSKNITSFSVVGAEAIISGTNISVTVPFGTDVSNLTPSITHTGTGIAPALGTAQDFSLPITYTVTAEDGSTQDYTVTVTVASSSSKAITSFSLEGVEANIAGTVISVTLPFGTNISALTPVISHTGASINPNGVAQDFNVPVTYTVTAADTTTQDYTVNVTVASSSSKAITDFVLAGVDATISGTNINVTVPSGTDISSIAPTITYTGVSVNPGSGVLQDFSVGPVTYTVTAADTSTQNYTVNVTVATSSSRAIMSFAVNGVEGVIVGTNISVVVPYGTNLTSLIPDITHTGTSINPGLGVAQDFSLGSVTYIVTAANLLTRTYTVNVTAALSSAKALTSFSINGVAGVYSNNGMTITVALPLGTPLNNLVADFTTSSIAVGPVTIAGIVQDSGITVNDYSLFPTTTYRVTAEDGSFQD